MRDYWVYVPKQYDPAKPACVHVNQDGLQYNAPAVFDKLIHEKAMPVTIGVFVRPGVVPAPSNQAQPRFNRSFEYDGLGDNYARFLLEELLPDVERKKTEDGRPIRLSQDGNDRSIEQLVVAMTKNATLQNQAVSMPRTQLRLLRTIISENTAT